MALDKNKDKTNILEETKFFSCLNKIIDNDPDFSTIFLFADIIKKYIDKMSCVRKNSISSKYLKMAHSFEKLKNYDKMKKYYRLSICFKNHQAMFALGLYYENVEKDYQQMKKYYLMAIDYGNTNAMYYLGKYYQFVKKNPELMKKYYLMAIKNGDTNSLRNLRLYYQQA